MPARSSPEDGAAEAYGGGEVARTRSVMPVKSGWRRVWPSVRVMDDPLGGRWRSLHEPLRAPPATAAARSCAGKASGGALWLLLILAHAPLALAWGPQGHRTVGAI